MPELAIGQLENGVAVPALKISFNHALDHARASLRAPLIDTRNGQSILGEPAIERVELCRERFVETRGFELVGTHGLVDVDGRACCKGWGVGEAEDRCREDESHSE